MAKVEHDLTDAQWHWLMDAWGGCAYCGGDGAALQKDCMLPISRGGRYTLMNVVPACGSCNASKCNTEVTTWLRRKRLDEGAFLVRQADVLRQIDKFDKVGEAGVRELLTTGRTDASGAEIEGVGLDASQAEPVLRFLTSKGDDNATTLQNLRAAVGGSAVGAEGVDELAQIAAMLEAMGMGADRVVIDPSVVRGLGYYTGPVFEAELTFEILDDKGRKRQFGSVAGGGRYDDLVERFTGQKVPATGVSIGVDRLLAALREKGLAGTEAQGPVVVTVMDRDRMADYQAMAAELRAAGIRAEVYLGNPKNFGNQLKYADKRAAPIAIIQGADEAARGVVQVKDLILGAKIAAQASVEEWKSQPAQVEIPRAALVATVREMLAR